jgi:hypothetical protein
LNSLPEPMAYEGYVAGPPKGVSAAPKVMAPSSMINPVVTRDFPRGVSMERQVMETAPMPIERRITP